MTDVERRITDALRGAATEAPPAVGLADAARARRVRRRRTTVWTSTVAVAAVVAVVGGVAVLGSRDGAAPQVADDPTPTEVSTTAAGEPAERVETWRDLSVTVPSAWGYGVLSTWCSNGATEPGAPVVERTSGMRDLILCTEPANGYGVQFQDGAALDFVYRPGEVWQYEAGDFAVYPVGAWMGYQRAGNNVVLVVTADRATTEQVLASYRRVADVDANGCTPRSGNAAGVSPGDGQVRLCRYDEGGWLDQSEVLTGQDASDAMAALDAAPAKGDRMCTAIATPFVLVSGSGSEGRVALDSCQGLTWDGGDHDLTGDVLRWVLSPGWSGQVPDGITFEPRR